MILRSCPPWCHITLSLRKAWMMTGRRGIVNRGAGTMSFGPSWRPPLPDEAGTTLVILPVFASLLTVLIPWDSPCPALMWGVHYDSDSPSHSFVVFAPGLLSYKVPFADLFSSPASMLPGSQLVQGHPTSHQGKIMPYPSPLLLSALLGASQ